jgi:hypothetical protein
MTEVALNHVARVWSEMMTAKNALREKERELQEAVRRVPPDPYAWQLVESLVPKRLRRKP